MRSVAECAIAAVLAAAEINRAIFFGGIGGWRKAASLVGAVAERLSGTLATGAPVVGFSGFDGNGDRGFLSNNRFGHRMRNG